MTEDQKKVEFRIRYSKKTPESAPQQEPRLITEWHYNRIIGGLIMFVIIAVVVIKLMNGSETSTNVAASVAQNPKPSALAKEVVTQPELEPQNNALLASTTDVKKPVRTMPDPSPEPASSSTRQSLNESATVLTSLNQTRPVGITKHVLRSQLAQGMWENEPFGDVSLPVTVNSAEATGLFYFTELAQMQGQSVYHVWKHNAKTIFQQKKLIANNHTKTYTSKLFTRASIGAWTVSLTDSELKPLHSIQFNVVAEE